MSLPKHGDYLWLSNSRGGVVESAREENGLLIITVTVFIPKDRLSEPETRASGAGGSFDVWQYLHPARGDALELLAANIS